MARLKPTAAEAARRAELARRGWRAAFLASGFVAAMTASALQLATKAAEGERSGGSSREETAEPRPTAAPRRAAIVDRHGALLIDNLLTYALVYNGRSGATPEERREAADAVVALFPDLDHTATLRLFERGGTSLVRRPLTPREAQAAHDLGIPGLALEERVDRVNVAGRVAAHVLGYTDVDGRGLAGVERALDARLSRRGAEAADPDADGPLRLSIDLRVQNAVWETLVAASVATGAEAASAVVLDARSGETLALVSLPDFDPHRRPSPPRTPEEAEASPLFHRAVAGRYELGSVMKIVTWALALETGVADMNEVYDAPKPFEVGGFTIRDLHPTGDIGFRTAFAKSSNIVAARLALEAGPQAQRRLFQALGLTESLPLEVSEARRSEPLWHRASETTTATSAYGHGMALSPVHLAAATASLVNGGLRVRPTLLARDPNATEPEPEPERVVSPETSKHMRELMRLVVTEGTGRAADAPGLDVIGKTGTADKPSRTGGYDKDRVIATFAAAFPMAKPRYVVVVMLDEPEIEDGGEAVRGAGRTAAPVARDIIARIAPLLGVPAYREAAGL